MNNNQALTEKLLEKVLSFIAYAPRSRKEVRDRIERFFFKKDLSEEEKEEIRSNVWDAVEKLGLLNDEIYAQTYVEGQIRAGKKTSKKKIAAFLFGKGISKEATDLALERYSTEHEWETVKELADKKHKSLLLKETDQRKVKQKLITYLLTKGFSPDTVFEVTGQILP